MKNIYGITDIVGTKIVRRGRVVFREGEDVDVYGPDSVVAYVNGQGFDSIVGNVELSTKYVNASGFLDEDDEGFIVLSIFAATRGDDEFYGPSIRVDETKGEDDLSAVEIRFSRSEKWDRPRGQFDDPMMKWNLDLDPHGDDIGFRIYRTPTVIDSDRNINDVEVGDVFIDDDNTIHVLTEGNLHVEEGWRLIADEVVNVEV